MNIAILYEQALREKWNLLQERIDIDFIPGENCRYYDELSYRDGISTLEKEEQAVVLADVRRERESLKKNYERVNSEVSNVRHPCDDRALLSYCREIWVAEQGVANSAASTKAIKECIAIIRQGGLIENGIIDSVRAVVPNKSEEAIEKDARKIFNIVTTALYYFSCSDAAPVSVAKERINRGEQLITEELVVDIHRMLMRAIATDNELDIFRQDLAHSNELSRIYVDHNEIEPRLNVLLKFVEEKRTASIGMHENAFERFYYLLGLGGMFISEFLHIHPFENGNGRTCRLLFSILMADCVAVPLSFFKSRKAGLTSREEQRKCYVESLEKSRGSDIPPLAIVRYVIESANNHLQELLSF